MANQLLRIEKDGFYLNDEKFFLASGDIHYFRIYPTDWERRLLLMKDFGLTAIQTYVPWNLHEPKKGKFNFEGILDLEKFLKLTDGLGLKVLFRPAPFICSECDFGGMPSWLLKERDMEPRCCDPSFLNAVKNYYKELIPRILPYLSTNGGPIIMVAVENEYGGSGYDKEYLKFLADTMKDLGVNVPFYTTDNEISMLNIGSLPGTFLGANFRSTPGTCKIFADYMEKRFPEYPFFVGELWAGCSSYWGDPFYYRDPAEVAASYKECLERGFVNSYMFTGGTNFGFFSGAIEGTSFRSKPQTPSRYIAHTTSYDVDAPISENGVPKEKYYLMRAELDKFLGKEVRPKEDYPYEAQKLNIKFSKCAYLFDNLDALTETEADSIGPKPMEDYGQDYGFILYTTSIEGYPEAGKCNINIGGLRDRATLYGDGEYLGKYTRDRKEETIKVDMTDRNLHLDVLVENVARINTGKNINFERKGILGYVQFKFAKHYHWHTRTLPMNDISGLSYKPLTDIKDNQPVFLKGTFDANKGVDTFLDMRGWGRGFVVINGFNIGRFWEVGPQYTLYVPGGLLKEKDNTIEVFDVNHKDNIKELNGIKEHIMEGEGIEE
ncbi:MAG: beta-galactosidase [Bacillota bacterium]|nr:beta-galactosidase [Bacillota bacterium]